MSDDHDSEKPGGPGESASKSGPSGEAASGESASGGGATEGGAARDEAAPESAPRPRRVDEDGLPLDREATIDDVRSTSGMHGRYALGCTIVIVALIVAFWLIRGGLGGG